jgi:hypothetical protein
MFFMRFKGLFGNQRVVGQARQESKELRWPKHRLSGPTQLGTQLLAVLLLARVAKIVTQWKWRDGCTQWTFRSTGV